VINKYAHVVSAAVIATTLSVIFASPAFAAAKTNTSRPLSDPVGYDVSWPQCKAVLPSGPDFVVVGVNGGKADEANPCLRQQLEWAKTASGTSDQPGLQLYLNTANPGSSSDSWPTNNINPFGDTTTNRYGLCNGGDTQACAWQYGYNKAYISHNGFFVPAADSAGVSIDVADYVWWLDVEFDNSWQLGSEEAQVRNRAVLEGMTDYLKLSNAKAVGVYSTTKWWTDITGGKDKTPVSSSLNNMPDWRPSGTLAIAKYNCKKAPPLTNGGRVSLTQYVVAGLDRNYSCPV
jgi:hypothetical protein